MHPRFCSRVCSRVCSHVCSHSRYDQHGTLVPQLTSSEIDDRGRKIVGIEREQAYIDAAEERLSRVRAYEKAALCVSQGKRAEPRVPFGTLVERGLLRPGETLVNAKGVMAKIRADGTLSSDKLTGSIHQVGAAIDGAPSCNGWTYWSFIRDGQRVPIDSLRQQIRAELI